MDKLDKQTLGALALALTTAITVAVVTSGSEPSKIDRPVIDLGGGSAGQPAPAPTPAKIDVDSHAYTTQIKAYRETHPGTVDLLTAPVEPGAQVTTGVTLELGKRATDVQPIGGSWTIDSTTYRDDETSTWIEVKATNTGTQAARFIGIIQVTP